MSKEAAMVEWAKFVASVIASVVAACWAFSKWIAEREKERRARTDQHDQERNDRINERERERKRFAALYVNPFLLACEELQSRLYNILERKGLSALKKRYPDGDYSEETLYLIAQYFAWEHCLYRYTRYAQDPEVILLTESIRKVFATDELGVRAFCFYRPEQRSLGRLLLERAGGEFDVISFHTFKGRLASMQFGESPAIQQTLSVLKECESMEELDSKDPNVRKRLAKIQSFLVTLLAQIERKEQITFFFPDDGSQRLTAKEIPPSKPTEAGDKA